MFAVRLYRLYRYLFLLRVPFLPWLFKTLNRVIFATVLPPSATLGRNVVLSYEGLGTVIHKRAVIGDRTIIGTGVTIGGRSGSEAVPVIGESVLIGSGAKILGAVKIGSYSSIGANSVVLTDIPDFAVAVGIPARVVKINKPEDIPDYFAFKKNQ